MGKGALFLRHGSGFSMVELLVATLVTLVGLVVITQVFAVYEGWKRTTTGVAQTQEAGLLGAFAIEQDLRNAGFGMIGTSCTKIFTYNANATPSNLIKLSGNGMAVNILRSDESDLAKRNDKLSILYSSSPYANIPGKLQLGMEKASDVLRVDNGMGFAANDLILISNNESCSIMQISDPPEPNKGGNVTSSGSSWELPHAAGKAPWNPTDSKVLFPSAGYSLGDSVRNMGQLIEHIYYVQDNTLRMEERDSANGSLTSYDLIPGVVGLRARYGRDTNGDGVLDVFDNETEKLKVAGVNTLLAVQFGLIVRSGNREKAQVSPASIDYWPGESLELKSGDDRQYRYRVFTTIVPFKNVIWNPK